MFIIKKVYKKGGWTVQQVSSTSGEVETSRPKRFTTGKLIEFLTNVRVTHIERVNNLKNYKIEFWGLTSRLPLKYQYLQSLELSIDEVINFLRIWSERQDFTLEAK